MSHSLMTDADHIRNCIASYAKCLDFKDFDGLARVFTPDAVSVYPPPLQTYRGVGELQEGMERLLRSFKSQHNITTQTIEITSPNTAYAESYVWAGHWRQDIKEDNYVYMMGCYQDKLLKTNSVDGKSWKIQGRNVIPLGVPLGNVGLLGL
ncbi:hypothetical protein PV08_05142 [Exophiala spinifera]|uniref:SnoaL-like domain-containing protein n=1 Tax=Exophiala spinifera TaxID=91928 RepID=A0A0D1ZZ60_9EURO|nr:uncharacterized protein PV08_05142 [Exophiala spinifera]KIW17947.1 hypothetical protein PV08_05142 [Exophiala spinifera]